MKTLCCIHLLWHWFTRADEVSGEWWPLHLMWCMRDGLLDMNKQFLLTKHSQGLSWHMFRKHLSSGCDLHCLYMCTLHVQWDVGRWCRFQHMNLTLQKFHMKLKFIQRKIKIKRKSVHRIIAEAKHEEENLVAVLQVPFESFQKMKFACNISCTSKMVAFCHKSRIRLAYIASEESSQGSCLK